MTIKSNIPDERESNLGSQQPVSQALPVQAPTGTLAAILTAIMVGAQIVGIDISPVLATAIVIVPAFIVSYFKPRWAKTNGLWYNHPAAATAAATTIVVAIAQAIGVTDLDAAAVTGIIGGLTAIVGILTPRSA